MTVTRLDLLHKQKNGGTHRCCSKSNSQLPIEGPTIGSKRWVNALLVNALDTSRHQG